MVVAQFMRAAERKAPDDGHERKKHGGRRPLAQEQSGKNNSEKGRGAFYRLRE